MRIESLNQAKPCIIWPNLARLACRLRMAVSAVALGMTIGAPCASALEINGLDDLNTATIASQDRAQYWSSGASRADRTFATPDGIRMGNYLVLPEAGAVVVFDDNIFAHDTNKQSDIRTETSGEVLLKSSLPRHVLDFSLDGRIVNYLEHTELDSANIRAKLQGALHFDNATTLSATALSALESEDSSAPTYPSQAIGPISVFHNRVSAGITRDVGRLYGTISSAAESWSYGDENSANGPLPNSGGRDNQIYSGQIRSGYRISPGFDFVTKLRTFRQENAGTAKLDRDAWGYEALAGLAFETNPMLRWHIMGGYGVRDFDAAKISNFATTLLEADVQWLPTQRLSVFAAVSQQILEETDNASSAIIQTGGQLRAEYELYHNLVLTGGVELRQDDYKGIDRTDIIYSARTELEYLFSKNWLFTFGYEHQVRDSSDDSNDMHRNRFMLGAKLRF